MGSTLSGALLKVKFEKFSEASLVVAVFTIHQQRSLEFEELLAVLQEVLDQHNLYVCSRDERTHLNVVGATASACSERARDLSCFFVRIERKMCSWPSGQNKAPSLSGYLDVLSPQSDMRSDTGVLCSGCLAKKREQSSHRAPQYTKVAATACSLRE